MEKYWTKYHEIKMGEDQLYGPPKIKDLEDSESECNDKKQRQRKYVINYE